METSFKSRSTEIFYFAETFCAAGRIFTLHQLARHPFVSGLTQPEKRLHDLLQPYRERFDVLPWYRNKPYLWRLTQAYKQSKGYHYRNVSASQHADHWLAIGDVWLELIFSGLRPEKWFTEGNEIGRFDVFAIIREQPYLMEIQLTNLSEREWFVKWKRRTEWLQERKWRDVMWAEKFSNRVPKLLLVTTHQMKLEIGRHVPEGVVIANTVKELPRILNRI